MHQMEHFLKSAGNDFTSYDHVTLKLFNIILSKTFFCN